MTNKRLNRSFTMIELSMRKKIVTTIFVFFCLGVPLRASPLHWQGLGFPFTQISTNTRPVIWAYDPKGAQIYFSSEKEGFYKTSDGGVSWGKVRSNSWKQDWNFLRNGLTVDPIAGD